MAKKTLSFQVSDALYNRLHDHCTEFELTTSAVIRAALLRYLNSMSYPTRDGERHPATPAESFQAPEVDKDIQPAFSVGGLIPKVAEEGAALRLRQMGIDPTAVVRARRAKKHGREYDTSMEQYFDMV